jgi:ferredoxin
MTRKEVSMAKPVINEELCEGCSSCVELCPEVFQLGNDEKAHVIGPDKCNTCNCQEAADLCPTQAITLE